MSLRSFHIFFIAVSGILCLWLLGWGYANLQKDMAAALIAFGAAGFIGLAFYLRYFLRSSRPSNGSRVKFAIPALVSAAIFSPRVSWACTACMGQAEGDVGRAFFYGIAFLALLVLSTLAGISLMMYRAAKAHDQRSEAAATR